MTDCKMCNVASDESTITADQTLSDKSDFCLLRMFCNTESIEVVLAAAPTPAMKEFH